MDVPSMYARPFQMHKSEMGTYDYVSLKGRKEVLEQLLTYFTWIVGTPSHYNFGLCFTLSRYFDWPGLISRNSFEIYLPELYAQKPIRARDYWFSRNKAGHQKRVEVIEKALILINQKIQSQ